MKTQTHKTKNLRYLAPEYIAEPDLFLKEEVYQWGINWSVNFGFLFTYSMCPQLDKNRVFEYGFYYLHLAQMIEAAYTIMTVRNWLPTRKKKLFQYKDWREIGSLLERDNIDPKRTICDFFGFMDLHEWYELLDWLLIHLFEYENLDDTVSVTVNELIAREFILLLPDALLRLHQENTISNNS